MKILCLVILSLAISCSATVHYDDPCDDFIDRNTICVIVDFAEVSCECKEGFYLVHQGDPCAGCQGTIILFSPPRRPCAGCQVPSNYNYENYGIFGWLKVPEIWLDWKSARQYCLAEGGDIFIPGTKQPIFPEEMSSNFKFENYWVGVKRGSDTGESPFLRIDDQSVIPDNSPLWGEGQPSRYENEQCVYYYTVEEGLHDTTCDRNKPFICSLMKS